MSGNADRYVPASPSTPSGPSGRGFLGSGRRARPTNRLTALLFSPAGTAPPFASSAVASYPPWRVYPSLPRIGTHEGAALSGLAGADAGRVFSEREASKEVADVCYSYRDHEAREAQEEARKRAKREREEGRRRDGETREAGRRAPEKERELVRA